VLANPFINPVRIKPDYSPVDLPSKHKSQNASQRADLCLSWSPTFKWASSIWFPIRATSTVRMECQRWTWLKNADARLSNGRQGRGSKFRKLSEDDQQQDLARLPEASTAPVHPTGVFGEEVGEAQLDAVVQHMKAELARRPICTVAASSRRRVSGS